MPEQGDAHDDAGEQDGPARGVDGGDDGRFGVPAGEQPLAVPGDDEQGVVDADPEADQQHELGRELRHLQHVAQHPDDADGRPREAQGAEQRQRAPRRPTRTRPAGRRPPAGCRGRCRRWRPCWPARPPGRPPGCSGCRWRRPGRSPRTSSRPASLMNCDCRSKVTVANVDRPVLADAGRSPRA